MKKISSSEKMKITTFLMFYLLLWGWRIIANKSKWEWKSGKQYFSNEKPQSNLFFMILISMNVKKLKFLKISLVSLLLCFICSSTFHKNSTACMLMLFCCELIEGSKINVKNNADAFNLNKEKGRILWKKGRKSFS